MFKSNILMPLLATVIGLVLSFIGHTQPVTQNRVLVLATHHVSESKLRMLSELARDGGTITVDYRYDRSIEEGASLAELVAPYDMVIFDAISAPQTTQSYVPFEAIINEARIYLPIKLLDETPLREGISNTNAAEMHAYYYNGGEENLRRMLAFMTSEIFGRGSAMIEPPIVFAETGIYHPDYDRLVFDSFASFTSWRGAMLDGETPVVGLSMSRESIAAGDTRLIDTIIGEIEARGAVAVPYYYPGYSEGEQVNILQQDGVTAVDAIINTRIIHWSARRAQEFEALGVPVLQALPYSAGPQEEWEAFAGGLPASTTPFYLTLPEIAGVADPIIIAARDENNQLTAIDYQLDMVIERALNHIALARTNNADKQIALMFYNYPPGERSAGASFLNAPRSIDGILEQMGAAGYTVEDHNEDWFIDRVESMLRPYYRDMSYTQLAGIDEAGGSAGLLPVARYLEWFETLPRSVQNEINAHWGPAHETFSVADINDQAQFIIPRVMSGNVMILPQPPRGSRAAEEGEIFHDESIPVSHNYLAVYFYVREQYGANAIIHLGTHGSQEWLPGKERGLSRYDAGNLAVGNTPVIYPFIMDDVGEAIQAKRRGRAIMISHLTPPMSQSGLYAQLAQLHDLMHQYEQLDEGAVRQGTRDQLIATVIEQNLHQDTGWTEADMVERFDLFLDDLHAWMGELGTEIQPLGLHTFGQLPEDAHLTSTLVQMLGGSYAERAGDAAEYLLGHNEEAEHTHSDEGRTHADEHTHDGETHVHDDEADHHAGDHAHDDGHDDELDHANAHPGEADFRRLQDSPAYQIVERFVMMGDDLSVVRDAELRADLEHGREYMTGFREIGEYSALLAALEGRFVTPTVGGDPVRHPEALPSGGNLYGFDPSKMPTQAAWQAGWDLTESMLAEYHNEHGVYPDKVTYSLWAIEAMRHLGVVEAQAMAAMGVRPVWNQMGYVTGVEVIPYSELGRPRVDVVLSVTGLYRDALPNLVQLLASAAEDVAALEEDNNYVRINALRLRDELVAEGLDPQEAQQISTLRVFSNETGAYGTGLNGASMASGEWEGDERLAEMYLSRMGYAYGADDAVWSRDLRDINLYARNISGTDAAVFSRSSNVYGLLTSDDPFQYMGGISLAVRHLDGTSPQMFISNLRDTENMRTEALGQFLSRELRTRQFHPQWIDAMQEEGYAGTLAMLDATNNFWGWQVVDPQNVRDDQWQEFFEVYVQDRYDMDMREWFEAANPHALAQMIERMLEAERKDYWDTDAATLAELVETYVELANAFDVYSSNEAFKDYVAVQAIGFGLEPLSQLAMTTRPSLPQVQGQVLQQIQSADDAEPDFRWPLLFLVILAPFALGTARQATTRIRRQD
jgi:cobaltochelatase CobN